MAASEAIIIDAGGRDLRVSNPSRVIFPATDRSGPVTKLDIVNYYLAVADGIMRAVGRRLCIVGIPASGSSARTSTPPGVPSGSQIRLRH